MVTRLSVNVNKIATLRNARGGDIPNLVQVVKDLEKFGVQGILSILDQTKDILP